MKSSTSNILQYMEVKNCGPRCYWELGEHFGNTLGTLRKKKREKNSSPPKPKRKKKLAPLMHAEPSHWLHEIFIFSKTIYHQSWPGLITPL
jgi:hypothetical protein